MRDSVRLWWFAASAFVAACTTAAKPHPDTAQVDAAPDSDTGMGTPDTPTDTSDRTPPDDTASDDTGDTDPGETPEAARWLPGPDPALTVSDRIDPPGDADWYAVDLNAGDTLWVAVLAELRTPVSPLSPRLEVRDDTGATLHVARGMPLSLAGLDTALAFEAPSTGRFYFGVQAASPSGASLSPDPEQGGPEHAYSLRLEVAEPFEAEPFNDTPASFAEWLIEDGHYAFRGDPFLAGWPLFSYRADRTADRDVWPWTVRGETSAGTPTDWELWSWSPWPGCATTSTWTVSAQPTDAAATTLASSAAADLHTDPLWQLARHNLPVLPDVGLLVAVPPGEMWLTVDHTPSAPTPGSACTGILAGWHTDAILRDTHLAASADGELLLEPESIADDHRVTLVWGHLAGEESDHFTWTAAAPLPYAQVLVQATSIGYPLDTSITLSRGEDAPHAAQHNPIDGGPDPELWNISTAGTGPLRLTVHAESGAGQYLLQIHETSRPLP